MATVQDIRAEYVRHFLSDEFVVGREKEARLFKNIIDTITAEDVQQVAKELRSSASCVVKAVSHRKCALVLPCICDLLHARIHCHLHLACMKQVNGSAPDMLVQRLVSPTYTHLEPSTEFSCQLPGVQEGFANQVGQNLSLTGDTPAA